MTYFTKVYKDDKTFFIREHDDSIAIEWFRDNIPETYPIYVDWIGKGNTPALIPGNKYVTITNNVVVFDSISYNSDRIAEQKKNFELEYDAKFNELSRAFLNASILNDTTTVTNARLAYQTLLTEYNERISEIV